MSDLGNTVTDTVGIMLLIYIFWEITRGKYFTEVIGPDVTL